MGGIQLRFGERAGEKLATKGCPLDPATPPHLQLPPCTEVTLGDPPSPLPISLHPRCSQRGPTARRYMEAGALGATHTNQTHGSHTSEWQTQYGDNSWLPASGLWLSADSTHFGSAGISGPGKAWQKLSTCPVSACGFSERGSLAGGGDGAGTSTASIPWIPPAIPLQTLHGTPLAGWHIPGVLQPGEEQVHHDADDDEDVGGEEIGQRAVSDIGCHCQVYHRGHGADGATHGLVCVWEQRWAQ